MKTILIISFFTLGILLFTAILKQTRAETEKQKYKMLYKTGTFEIRWYPEAILATTALKSDYDSSRNSGFSVLATYIFGGNKENQKIAMTAPVRMSANTESNSMSFVLPSDMEYQSVPEPLNDEIVLHKSEAVYAAVIRFGGYTNSREIERKKSDLKTELDKLGLEHKGNFEFLGYNAPFDFYNRRNEVWVALRDFDPDTFRKAIAEK